jgi:hypothetical protein
MQPAPIDVWGGGSRSASEAIFGWDYEMQLGTICNESKIWLNFK